MTKPTFVTLLGTILFTCAVLFSFGALASAQGPKAYRTANGKLVCVHVTAKLTVCTVR